MMINPVLLRYIASCLLLMGGMVVVSSQSAANEISTAEIIVNSGAEVDGVPQDFYPKALSIGGSMSIPPWVIKEHDSGIELDILKEAFEQVNYRVSPQYMPFARAIELFELGRIDGLINARPGVLKKGYLSDVVVTFQNVAVSLESKGFPKNFELNFLRDKQVVAFQRAARYLGEDFAKVITGNNRYQEVSKQALQINLLFVREVDFIVLDKSIFGYYWNQAVQNSAEGKTEKLFKSYRQPVVLRPVFPKSDYSFAFKKANIRDKFNAGLRVLKQSGRYQEILDRYNHLKYLREE